MSVDCVEHLCCEARKAAYYVNNQVRKARDARTQIAPLAVRPLDQDRQREYVRLYGVVHGRKKKRRSDGAGPVEKVRKVINETAGRLLQIFG